MRTVAIEEQLKCAKRELAMRKTNYPRWVQGDNMSQIHMDREIEGMTAIVATLTTLSKQMNLFETT